MSDAELKGLVAFLYEMGQLKRSKRTGWWLAGVKDPESIAEHSFRTAIIGHLLAVMEGADPARTALLCLFHDTQETRVGDIPSVGRGYLAAAPNERITEDQIAEFPGEVGRAVRDLVEEYEGRTSLEAQVARDADKLECLIQAREYRVQGYENVTPWEETSAASLRTVSAKRLAEACQQIPPGEWWRPFVEAYGRTSAPSSNSEPESHEG